MYLHLGQNTVVTKDSIIGIFDLDNSSWSFITRKYLSDAEKRGKLINVSDDIPKSFIVCSEYEDSESVKYDESNVADKSKVYLSQLSSQTLLKRAESTLLI